MFGRRSCSKLCGANGILSREDIFDNIWVQPAAGDAGGVTWGSSCCVAYFISIRSDVHSDERDEMSGSYLGPSFSNERH